MLSHYKCPQICLPRTQAVGWCLEYTMINTVGSVHGGSALDPFPNQAHGALTTFWAQMPHFCLYQFCYLECLSLPSKHLLPVYIQGITAAMESLPNTQLRAQVYTSLCGCCFTSAHLTCLWWLTGTALLLQVSQYLACVLKPGWELVPLTAVSTARSYTLSSVTPPATSSGNTCLVFCTGSSSEPETCSDVPECAQPCSFRSGGQKWSTGSQSPSQ